MADFTGDISRQIDSMNRTKDKKNTAGGGFVAGYDPTAVSDFERQKNETIAKAALHNWGGRVIYDPNTGKLVDTRNPSRPVKDGDRVLQTTLKNFYVNSIRKQALDNYSKFNPDEYVKGESDVYRRNLAQQVVQQQKQVQADQNARGMLNSGRTQKRTAEVNQAANEDYAQKRNELVQSALQQKQRLGLDPLTGLQNANISTLQDKYNQAANQQTTDHSADYAAIGKGIGSIAAGSKDDKVTNPQIQTKVP